MQGERENSPSTLKLSRVPVLEKKVWGYLKYKGTVMKRISDPPDCVLLEDIVGNGLAKTNMWASLKYNKDGYEICAGSSVTLTCNQDDDTIKQGQKVALAYALVGVRQACGNLEDEIEK